METNRVSKESTDFKELRESSNYREFLKNYLEARSLSLSDFARATGFGRGFPGEVLSGKRRLTAKSYPPFEKALKLPLIGKKIFKNLVALEEGDLFPDLSRAQARQNLAELRTRPWNRPHRRLFEKDHTSFQHLLQDSDVIGVYAAAGTPESGATGDQIRQRTRLSERDLETSLLKLENAGLLKKIENRYFPTDLHLFLQTSDMSRLLTSLFQNAAERAHRRAPTGVSSPVEFYFTSQFCVHEKDLPALKAALRETILKFVDDSLVAEGDRVVRLLTALHL